MFLFYNENVSRMYIFFMCQGKAAVFSQLFKRTPKKLTSLPAQEVEHVFTEDRHLKLFYTVCWFTDASWNNKFIV